MERYYQKGPESLENQGGMGQLMTEKNGKVSARPATPNRETAAKGEKSERHRVRDTQSLM